MTLARHRTALVAAVAATLLAGVALVASPAARRGSVADLPSAAASSSSPAPAADAEGSSAARGVTELLRRRAEAVLQHDGTAFLATVDPKGSAAFRTAQRTLFANLAAVPLSAWDYTVDAASLTETAGLSTGGAAADQLYAPAVRLRYGLTGVDTAPTERDLGYLFDRRGGSWYLVSDTALDDRGKHTWRGPWDFGPCRVTTNSAGLVIYHPDNAATAARAARELGPAVRAVDVVWGTGWSGQVAIVLPDSEQELRAMVGPDFAVDSIAAVAISDNIDVAHHEAQGQRVVLNPQGAAKLSSGALRVVLRHEITHVAARGYTVDGAPMWMLEGFADYVGYRDSGIPLAQAAPDLAAQVRLNGPPSALPANQDFRASASQLDLAYQEAWTVNSFLAKRYGESALVALYHRIAGGGAVDAAALDGELRAVLGVGRSDLLAGWREYLRDNFG